ncbi:uncharacterized protein RJT20DRAFT_58354 [Scheffersomyces xylosifermentans]|uniref:uncharacterized protein n=1 Tax=Scheffersomyces xylosifermentans TaxID=1304137 RepID=UPI00315D751F
MSQYNTSDTSPAAGITQLIFKLKNGADIGTGISPTVDFARNLLGPKVPNALVSYNVGNQINLFGGYPTNWDFAPSVAFAVIFFVIGLIHLGLFIINCSRGHYFYLTLGWVCYCILKVVGFGCRAAWAKDITRVATGLTSEVFCIVPAIVIVSLNLILAQRLFTWRHPVGGSRKLFWVIMIILYAFVVVLIGITVTASFVPYLDYISTSAFSNWKKVVMFTSACVIAYSFTSIALIGLSYWAPTKKDENLYTYQPWWIESFHTFYFVQPFAAQKAEETFMKRNHNHRHAIRVIAATHHHHNMVQGLSKQRGDLSHNKSILIIIATTFLIFVGTIGRAIATFQARPNFRASRICSPVAMYMCWGLLEALCHVLYLVGRVDLRFYRPDILPAKVRAIITAEQTYYPSEDEEEGDDDDDDDISSREYDERHKKNSYNAPTHDDSADDDEWNFVDVESSLSSHGTTSHRPPYPYEDKDQDDKDEFVF